jgi:hypothetical protein
MRKLVEVEEAKSLMTEAMDWSVFRWLLEKGRVRETADKANAALDALDKRVKARWRDEIRSAYGKSHGHDARNVKRHEAAADPGEPPVLTPETATFLEEVRHADQKAHRARMDAEKTFDEAERILSTSLAVEGCRKAIRSWDLHETAIRLAETGIASKAET